MSKAMKYFQSDQEVIALAFELMGKEGMLDPPPPSMFEDEDELPAEELDWDAPPVFRRLVYTNPYGDRVLGRSSYLAAIHEFIEAMARLAGRQ